ncbi:MAG: DUF2905 domain-containing protein [Bacillota bacterium]
MGPLFDIGKLLVLLGVLMLLAGGLLILLGKIPGIGRLPGDILVQRENFTFYFPLATMIIISILLTIVLNLVFRR